MPEKSRFERAKRAQQNRRIAGEARHFVSPFQAKLEAYFPVGWDLCPVRRYVPTPRTILVAEFVRLWSKLQKPNSHDFSYPL